MDVKELVKYGLLALAGWWVYNDFIAPNMATAAATGGGGVPAPPPVPDMPGAGAPAAPPPAPGSGQVIPPPAPAHQHHDTGTHAGGGLPAPSTDQLIKAATDPGFAASFRPDYLLNQHQWNWYRQKGGLSVSSADLSNDPNGYTMSAAEYHQRRASVGLSGVRGVSVPRYTVN